MNKKQFTKSTKSIVMYSEIKATHMRIYHLLLMYRDKKTSKARIGYATLMEKYGVSRNMINAAIKVLEEKGCIAVEKVKTRNHGGTEFNEYAFPLWDETPFKTIPYALSTTDLLDNTQRLFMYRAYFLEGTYGFVGTIASLSKTFGIPAKTLSNNKTIAILVEKGFLEKGLCKGKQYSVNHVFINNLSNELVGDTAVENAELINENQELKRALFSSNHDIKELSEENKNFKRHLGESAELVALGL